MRLGVVCRWLARGVCRLPPSDIDAHGFANIYYPTLKEIIFVSIKRLTGHILAHVIVDGAIASSLRFAVGRAGCQAHPSLGKQGAPRENLCNWTFWRNFGLGCVNQGLVVS